MEVRLGKSQRRAGALGSPRWLLGTKSALGSGRLPDKSLGWAAPARVSQHSVTPGSRGELVRGAAGFRSALVAQLEFDSGAARGPAPRFPVPPRQPPAVRQLRTSRAGGKLWQLCAPVPCRDDLRRLGSDPVPSQPGAQPRTLGACWGARRHWPWDCSWEVGGVASASSRLGSPLALEGAAPPDPEWGALAFGYLPGLLEPGCGAAHFSEASLGKVGGPSGWRERRLGPLYPGPGAAGGPAGGAGSGRGGGVGRGLQGPP